MRKKEILFFITALCAVTMTPIFSQPIVKTGIEVLRDRQRHDPFEMFFHFMNFNRVTPYFPYN